MSEHLPVLNPAAVAALLRASAVALRAELAALPDELAGWRPAPDAWCAKEVLGHLIEAEQRGFANRIAQLLAEPSPRFTGWDPPAVARSRGDDARPLTDLLAEFDRLRAASLALIGTVQAADLERGSTHPTVGWLTIGDLLHEWVHHDRNHLCQVLAMTQAAVWPHMGNARRFSPPSATGE